MGWGPSRAPHRSVPRCLQMHGLSCPRQAPGPPASRMMMPNMDTEDSGGFRAGMPAGSS